METTCVSCQKLLACTMLCMDPASQQSCAVYEPSAEEELDARVRFLESIGPLPISVKVTQMEFQPEGSQTAALRTVHRGLTGEHSLKELVSVPVRTVMSSWSDIIADLAAFCKRTGQPPAFIAVLEGSPQVAFEALGRVFQEHTSSKTPIAEVIVNTYGTAPVYAQQPAAPSALPSVAEASAPHPVVPEPVNTEATVESPAVAQPAARKPRSSSPRPKVTPTTGAVLTEIGNGMEQPEPDLSHMPPPALPVLPGAIPSTGAAGGNPQMPAPILPWLGVQGAGSGQPDARIAEMADKLNVLVADMTALRRELSELKTVQHRTEESVVQVAQRVSGVDAYLLTSLKQALPQHQGVAAAKTLSDIYR
ncbi:hypothetical protein EBT31_00040 [bacterium]|nr:hypothetical protein [bacterium]